LVDRGWLETERVTAPGSASVFAGFRFPREVISVAVRWYLRYGLSYRDVEELLAERGVTVDHVSIYRWVQRFAPEFIEAARPSRHAPGNRWFVDETYLKIAGKWAYLYRAVDQHGQVIDVLLSVRRDLAAARRFFTQAMRAGTVPVEVTTDRASVYPRVLDELAPSALHTFEQYANNPIEAGHGRLKARLRPMRGLKRHRSAGSSPPAMPSYRTCAAATTTSPTTSPTTTGSASPSKTSPPPSDQRSIPIMLRHSLGMTQRNSAVKPCGHAKSVAMLRSWLPQTLLIMNRFGLNYKRH
jgi:IS6 family transposase